MMQINIEVFKSSSSNKYFRRISPIISLENGIKFSVSTEAKYALINKSNGSVFYVGRFKFKNMNDLELKVSYKIHSEIVIITYKMVKDQKNDLNQI